MVASVAIVATAMAVATQPVQKLPIMLGVVAFILYLHFFTFFSYKLFFLKQVIVYISRINDKCQQ